MMRMILILPYVLGIFGWIEFAEAGEQPSSETNVVTESQIAAKKAGKKVTYKKKK